jgi:adenylylsulfate kinase-like enzyme
MAVENRLRSRYKWRKNKLQALPLGAALMAESKPPPSVQWHSGRVSREHIEARLRQQGAVIWLTGLSAAGKSTIANNVQRQVFDEGHLAIVLDGDQVRNGLCADLGFSPEDRRENVRRVAHVARLFADFGLMVNLAFI